MISYLGRMVAYNQWMNRKLYAKMEPFPEREIGGEILNSLKITKQDQGIRKAVMIPDVAAIQNKPTARRRHSPGYHP